MRKKIFFLLPFLLLAITKCEKPKRTKIRRDLDRKMVKSGRRPSAIYRMKQIGVSALSILILIPTIQKIYYYQYPRKFSFKVANISKPQVFIGGKVEVTLTHDKIDEENRYTYKIEGGKNNGTPQYLSGNKTTINCIPIRTDNLKLNIFDTHLSTLEKILSYNPLQYLISPLYAKKHCLLEIPLSIKSLGIKLRYNNKSTDNNLILNVEGNKGAEKIIKEAEFEEPILSHRGFTLPRNVTIKNKDGKIEITNLTNLSINSSLLSPYPPTITVQATFFGKKEQITLNVNHLFYEKMNIILTRHLKKEEDLKFYKEILREKFALYRASEEGKLNVVKHFIEEGANLNFQGNDGKTAFLVACLKGHLDVVKYFIDDQGVDYINEVDNYGNCALILAQKGKSKSSDTKNKNKYDELIKCLKSKKATTV